MKKIKSIVGKFSENIYLKHRVNAQIKKMNEKSRKKLADSVALSKEQTNQIQEFYKANFGKKIGTRWHRYYQAVSNVFCKEYVPEAIYTIYEKTVNNRKIGEAFSNKLLQYQILSSASDIHIPKLFCFVKKGQWYNADFLPISIENAIEILENAREVFVKPIADSNSGRGCHILKCNQESLRELSKAYKDNFMFSEIVKNSKEIATLHPYSVNTFRIMTYSLNGTVYTCPILMRIGRNKSNIDNAHAGGIFIGVTMDGKLRKYAVTEFGEKLDVHPDTKIVFDGYGIPEFKKMVEATQKLHPRFQGLEIISWDITLDENLIPTIIEVNTSGDQSPWLPQMANGESVFGDNTAKILQLLRPYNKMVNI